MLNWNHMLSLNLIGSNFWYNDIYVMTLNIHIRVLLLLMLLQLMMTLRQGTHQLVILIPCKQIILLFPIQRCLNNLFVNDMPKFLVKTSMVNDHAIVIQSKDEIIPCLHILLRSQESLPTSLCNPPLCLSTRVTAHKRCP